MAPNQILYNTIHRAIQEQQSYTGRKPSLVQINRQDYQELTSPSKALSTLGLSIDNVSVISFVDVEQGSFVVVP